MADTVKDPKRSGARPAGYVCHVCQAAIPVEAMVIVTLSGVWSVREADLPQLTRVLTLHREPCAHVYIQGWRADVLND